MHYIYFTRAFIKEKKYNVNLNKKLTTTFLDPSLMIKFIIVISILIEILNKKKVTIQFCSIYFLKIKLYRNDGTIANIVLLIMC